MTCAPDMSKLFIVERAFARATRPSTMNSTGRNIHSAPRWRVPTEFLTQERRF